MVNIIFENILELARWNTVATVLSLQVYVPKATLVLQLAQLLMGTYTYGLVLEMVEVLIMVSNQITGVCSTLYSTSLVSETTSVINTLIGLQMHLEKSCKACVSSGERGMDLTSNQKKNVKFHPE